MATKKLYGAEGRGDLLNFDPENLVLVKDPKHPLFDVRAIEPPDTAFESLVVSIMAQGVIEPVIIARDGESVLVAAGRRRVRAAIEANRRLKKAGAEPVYVPCKWTRGDDASLLGISIAENAIRKDESPVEKSRKAQRLIDLGRSEEDVARVFGVSLGAVKQWLTIGELAAPVQDAIERGEIAAAVATQLAPLSKSEQPKALVKLKEAGNTKGASAVQAARKVRDGVPTDSKEINLLGRRFVQRLVENLPEDSVVRETLQAMLGDLPVSKISDDDVAAAFRAAKRKS